MSEIRLWWQGLAQDQEQDQDPVRTRYREQVPEEFAPQPPARAPLERGLAPAPEAVARAQDAARARAQAKDQALAKAQALAQALAQAAAQVLAVAQAPAAALATRILEKERILAMATAKGLDMDNLQGMALALGRERILVLALALQMALERARLSREGDRSTW